MTRGLYPPETLSKEDVETLHTFRKDLFTQGLIGGGTLRRRFFLLIGGFLNGSIDALFGG